MTANAIGNFSLCIKDTGEYFSDKLKLIKYAFLSQSPNQE